MPYTDHKAAYEDLRNNVVEGIKDHFPIQGGLQTVELHGVEVKGEGLDSDDIRSQHAARVTGKTWSSTVYGDIALRDNATGKVISRKKIRLAEVPKVTPRLSHILEGKEYQVDNQWQLKPGVYVKRSAAGQLEAKFNVLNRRSFDVSFDPDSKQFRMVRGGSKAIPMYPIMKAMGVDDDTLEKSWGKEILDANRNAKGNSTSLEKVFKVDRKRAPKDAQEALEHLHETMADSQLRPDSTSVTLGKGFSNISGDVLKRATDRILAVQRGAAEDDRDSLVFKDLRSTGDYAREMLTARGTKQSVKSKAVRQMLRAKDVRDVVKFDTFNDFLKKTFNDNPLSNPAPQVNPVEMLANAQQTTIRGPGGVQNANAVDMMVDAKFINPSTFGFLDPVRTPESENSGVVLRLPVSVRKKNNEARIPLYNLKTHKMEFVGPKKFSESTVVLPDQMTWKNGVPTPVSKKVKISTKGNDFSEISASEADYTMSHPSQLFSITTNLIPFLGSNSGNRATYAGQHLEQAISLREREAPLVQVATPSNKPGIRSFEEVVGRQSGHTSPVDGKVFQVLKDAVIIKSKDGKSHEVQMYNNFPLNDPKSVLHSEATVKVGDKVGKGQSVADTNFTRGGTLALGANLQVGYLPYKGYNFEDGVVISESAARKLTSEHMHKPELAVDKDLVTDPRKFVVQHPDAFNRNQYKKLDNDGVIRLGQKVRTGDPMVVAMRPYQAKDRMSLQAIGRALTGRHTDISLRWQSDHEGEVVGVHKDKDKVAVHIRTQESMQVGDKLSGRHGNKGIVTRIIADKDMPRTKSGAHIEVALNPSGVPGRMNIGQILETVAGKIAQKTGKTYIVNNFGREDQLAKVKGELKKYGIPDQEELFDPASGMSLGKVMIGPQHMLKLMHTIDKKSSARSGMALSGGEEEPESYDSNLLPAGGGKASGQSIGGLDMYALLAHGAKANIREMQTWKSEGPDPQPNPAKQWQSQHHDVWRAIQMGEPLPTPKPTFSFQKFTDMLKATGVNLEKKGHHLQLLPMTNKQVEAMSSGELTKPGEVVYPSLDKKTGEPRPKPGGIFDEKKTGGHGGRKWSHIALAEPVPNPMFEGAIQRITGLTERDYLSVVQGKKAVDKFGKLTDIGTVGGITGGGGVVRILGQINVNKDLASAEKELSSTALPSGFAHKATPKIDKLVKKVKYLRALQDADMTPTDAYTLSKLPVIPPIMRPIATLKDGSVKWGDLNELYKNLGAINTAMKDPSQAKMDDEQKKELRTEYYDGVRALMGIGTPYADQTHKGIMHQISGSVAKKGYFQNVLMSRRQDMSTRSTIVPEPALDLDEVGLPRSLALSMYKPFVVRKLVEIGSAAHALEARDMVRNKDPAVARALELTVKERPIILKRDPALHRHSVQGFRPKLVSGKAIQIHPLVTSGYNADFDGDTMSAYVPISNEAVEEARKMMPSNNLYSEASGRVVYTPTLESALGLYKLSRIDKTTSSSFKTPVDALKAVNSGRLGINDVASISGERTTAGRVLIAQALPASMQKDTLKNHSQLIDSKGLNKMFTELADSHKGVYGEVANKLKDLGNGASYGLVPVFSGAKGPDAIREAEAHSTKFVMMPTHSFSLDDFTPDRVVRAKAFAEADKKISLLDNILGITKKEKERRSIDAWVTASDRMEKEHHAKMDKAPSNLSLMLKAGVKPKDFQYKQMVLAPVLMSNAAGNPIPHPIRQSYSEGLDVAGYWIQQQGARRGTVMKVQEVREPGTFSKRMVQNTMGLVVHGNDCGTDGGIALHVGDKNVYDRILAKDFSSKGASFSKGTKLSPDIVSTIRKADKGAKLLVRSPLKCEHAQGLCKQCAGLSANGQEYEDGANVGIIAAQALGERSVQLTMKAFHSGGVVQSSAGSKAVNDFERVQQLSWLPKSTPNSATVAMRSGRVDKIERDPTGVQVWVGGMRHHIGKDRYGNALHENLPNASKVDGYKPWAIPKVGARIEAGQTLSDPNRTLINPRDLYQATNNMEKVQNFLVDELHSIYGSDVRRQHVETSVKAMGNLTKISDPGDSEGILMGDFQSASQIRALNRKLVKSGKRPVEHSPVLKGVDHMPLSVQEDWMAKLQHVKLKDTIIEAAARGAQSDLHGFHPVPGAAYGAEFGLTSKDALKPGLRHLADVAESAY